MTAWPRAVVLAALLVGCAQPEPPAQGPSSRELLYELSDVYASSQLILKRPPARLADLNAGKRAGGGRALPAVERGELVVVWAVAFVPPGSPGPLKVLAYEKDAPSRGGWALHQDGSVKEVTAGAIKAGG